MNINVVTILILVENLLQLNMFNFKYRVINSHNPYFSGKPLAIIIAKD